MDDFRCQLAQKRSKVPTNSSVPDWVLQLALFFGAVAAIGYSDESGFRTFRNLASTYCAALTGFVLSWLGIVFVLFLVFFGCGKKSPNVAEIVLVSLPLLIGLPGALGGNIYRPGLQPVDMGLGVFFFNYRALLRFIVPFIHYLDGVGSHWTAKTFVAGANVTGRMGAFGYCDCRLRNTFR